MSDEMGIEMNYENTEGNFPEAERNNRDIQERFRIVYYWLPYKKISRIMIFHLAMNMTLNFNIFPAKGGVSVHYILHMIVSQRNCDYNKHF